MTREEIFNKTHIYIDMLGMNLHFTTNKDELEEMLKHHDKIENMNVNGKALSYMNEDGEYRFYIGLFTDDYSTLVHECSHIAFFIYEAIGQKLTYDDEMFCYLVANLFDKCREKWILQQAKELNK